MPTRNVVVTDHQARLIDTLVESGRYQNACEVLREGLRMIERREADDAARLAALREAWAEGVASGNAGPLDLDEVKAEARRRAAPPGA